MAKKSRSGFLFMFIIFILLGLVIYSYKEKFIVLLDSGLFNGKKIVKDLKEDNNKKGFFDRLPFTKNDKEKISLKPLKEVLKKDNEPLFEKRSEPQKIEEQNENPVIVQDEKKQDEVKEIKQEETRPLQEKVTYNTRSSKLYFTRVDGESLQLISVSRNIQYTNTPLTETLKSLLSGPTQNEKSESILTNIPHQTKLISVWIKGNTAFVNLSREFEFNTYGRDATLAQVKQIVYTTTEFSTVKTVQFLIDGKVKTYLGGEGILINKPLSRNDFS